MRSNPMIRPASTRPYHRCGPFTSGQRIGRVQPEAELLAEQLDTGPGWLPPPRSALALEELTAELAEFWGGRNQPHPDRSPFTNPHRSRAPDAGVWRDQQLEAIEDLAGELKRKVARYAKLRAVQSSGASMGPADAAGVAWIHQALEDIAATALGLEIASRELFLRAGGRGAGIKE